MRKVVYIAGPYTGPTHDASSYHIIDAHIWLARECAKKVWEMGAAALCPHMNTAHFECDCKAVPNDYYEGDLAMLVHCDAIYMMSAWKESKGAVLEKEFAEKHGIPIFYSMEAVKEWLANPAEKEQPIYTDCRANAHHVATEGIPARLAAKRQQTPSGNGKDVAELVCADVRKHRSAALTLESSYAQLMCIAFLLRRTFTNRKTYLSETAEEIVKDIQARVEMGEKKYGTRLKTHNGRDALLDGYQEVLDGLNYFRQKIEESKSPDSWVDQNWSV